MVLPLSRREGSGGAAEWGARAEFVRVGNVHFGLPPRTPREVPFPVILLAAYALFIFYLALRYRRRWTGFASVTFGVLFLLLIARPGMGEHNLIASMLPPGLRAGYKHLLILILPEAALIALVGFFIAALPRTHSPTACRSCNYELGGLDPAGLKCPECGCEWKGRGSGREDPPIVLTPIPRVATRKRVNL